MNSALISDGFADALGRIVADERANWRRAFEEERSNWKREADLVAAETRATIAELRSQNLEIRGQLDGFKSAVLSDLSARVDERLALVRDGRDGVDGKDGRDGVDGKDGDPGAAGRDGVDGKNGDPGIPGLDGKDGRNGVDGKDGDPGTPGRDGTDGLPGRDGTDGLPGRDGSDGLRGTDGRDGLDGKDGERGLEGPSGKLAIAREYKRGVHYESDVVTCGGSLWQATRDTGEAPGHEDWLLLAARGRDATEIEHRGSYDPDATYTRNSIVALDGGAFIALRDDPGVCPGDGWRLLVARGSRGKPGDRGERGAQGERGRDGVSILTASVEGFSLVLSRSDGTHEVCDLKPIFEEYHRQVRS